METLPFHIKKISSKNTFSVRHPVLRAGRPLEDCRFDGDDLESTFHLGLFEKEKLIGIASFFKASNPKFSETTQYQLRGMAILKPFQGRGLGKMILHFGETELKRQNIALLWCNAREAATQFYEALGYRKIGNPFEIKGIGIHYVMFKKL